MALARVAERAGIRTAIVGGGLVGALGRVGLEEMWPDAVDGVPWATLAVNLAGAFLLGLLVPVIAARGERTPLWLAPGLTVGALGSLTTFSLLVLEVWERGAEGHVALAAGYLAFTLAGGLAAAALGLRVGRGRA
jgi:fluoride exporter